MSQGFRVLGSQGFNVWCHFCLYDSVYWQCWGNLKVVLVMFAHSLTLLSDVNIFWRNSSDADHIGRQKMGRLGTADEIASLVLYLSSDEVEISCPWFLFSFSTSTQTMDMAPRSPCSSWWSWWRSPSPPTPPGPAMSLMEAGASERSCCWSIGELELLRKFGS